MTTSINGKFRQRLIETAHREGKNVWVIGEQYTTTNTYCKCGDINESIGRKDIFKCDNFRMREDSNVHSALKIFRKFLMQHSVDLAVIGKALYDWA